MDLVFAYNSECELLCLGVERGKVSDHQHMITCGSATLIAHHTKAAHVGDEFIHWIHGTVTLKKINRKTYVITDWDGNDYKVPVIL